MLIKQWVCSITLYLANLFLFHDIFSSHVQVDNFHNSELRQQLSQANLQFPVIVKPQVACGVADAHNMVLTFLFPSLHPHPLPASIFWFISMMVIEWIYLSFSYSTVVVCNKLMTCS